MKFVFEFQKTALHMAIENENTDIVRLLLAKPEIDVNIKYISLHIFQHSFNII